MEIGAQRPDVDIVDFLHAIDLQDGAGDLFQINIARQPFEQNVSALAKYPSTCPENHRAYRDADERIDPVRAGAANYDRAGNDGNIGERVAKIVNPDGTDVQVTAAAMKGERDAAIHHQRENRNPQHHPGFHFDRNAQPLDRFVNQEKSDDRQEHRIDEGREDAGAVISVGFFGGGRTHGPARGQPRNYHRGHVGQVVKSVANECD